MPKRKRRSYPTNEPMDVTDDQWAAIEPIVTTSSPKGGRPTALRQAQGGALSLPKRAAIDLRAIVNALISNHRTGRQWRMLPKDVPPISAGRYSFDQWRRDGTFVWINDALRTQARKAPGRDAVRHAHRARFDTLTARRAVRQPFGRRRAERFGKLTASLAEALRAPPAEGRRVLDSQSVKTTEAGGERGYDGKKGQRAQASILG